MQNKPIFPASSSSVSSEANIFNSYPESVKSVISPILNHIFLRTMNKELFYKTNPFQPALFIRWLDGATAALGVIK